MKCPACENELTTLMAGEVELDVCDGGCAGVWFDEHELDKVDEKHEFSGGRLFELKRDESITIDHDKQKQCPKCEGESLVRQFFDPQNQIEIDQCWNCAGIWLDTGELETARDQFETVEDRAAAVNTYTDAILAQHKAAMGRATQEELKNYNEAMDNRFTALVYAFKNLFGSS